MKQTIGNRLTPAEMERLVKLNEECGEVIKEISKIMLHGYNAVDKHGVAYDNRAALEREIGDVSSACKLMMDRGDIRSRMVQKYAIQKDSTIAEHMYHQGGHNA